MKKLLYLLVIGVFLLSACSPGEIEAHEPWARAAMAGENSAVYMMLHNHSDQGDELLSASSEIAEAVELHLSQMGPNGEMQMIPQTSIPLAAGEEVEFKPGGLHIMLIGLKQDLAIGDQFEATLHFKNHTDIVLTVEVKEGMEMDM
ncbi:MAG: copper chaperone PCu(A)C [Chloroflexota bacterium]